MEPEGPMYWTVFSKRTERLLEQGSDVESGFSFAPALRPHQRTQRRNGANGGQQDKAGQEKKSALHVLHRERPHDSSPLRLLQVYQFSYRPQSQSPDSLDFV